MLVISRILFAGNRMIGVEALRILLAHRLSPVGLLVPDGSPADRVDEIKNLLPGVPVFAGKEILQEDGTREALARMHVDYILSVHYPYILPHGILAAPRLGVLNLHPAYLPFNRGWHTPTWAIMDRTPYGATLHWVDEGVDTGAIALRRRIDVLWSDTADTLYKRAMRAELALLEEAIPLIVGNKMPRLEQEEPGTAHRKSELVSVQQLDLAEKTETANVLNKIRALTTDRWTEEARFHVDGKWYRVRVEIRAEEDLPR